MCTVTFLPIGDKDFVLTSNRDESPARRTIEPRIYEDEGIRLLYPKDELAGGSWIGTSSRNRVLCVLNGGYTFHERKPPYKTSRGLIMIELLKTEDLIGFIREFDWSGIEPFTLIAVDWNHGLHLYELVWDGKKENLTKLKPEPRIWSSSTLYDYEMKTKRKEWFDDFIERGVVNPEWRHIWNFHCEGGEFNEEFGFIMDRGFVKTTSITQIVKEGMSVGMSFHDCLKNESHEKQLDLSSIANG